MKCILPINKGETKELEDSHKELKTQLKSLKNKFYFQELELQKQKIQNFQYFRQLTELKANLKSLKDAKNFEL